MISEPTINSREVTELVGKEHIRNIREEIYQLIDERFGVALNIRLTNKRKTMALNGVC